MAKIVVGIDLGTTYSCIAAYVNNKFEVLTDYNGNKTMPSFVAFPGCSESGMEVGESAKKNFVVDPANRIFGKHILSFSMTVQFLMILMFSNQMQSG
jgi:molecular chaperone DnaK (HSP70)